jgi:2-keto-4-pentenoate hydratase
MAKRNPTTGIPALAKRLRTAMDSGKGCKPLRNDLPAGDLDAAYAVQEANTKYWLKAGRRPVGRKIGLTSKVVQTQLGVDQPDFGMLFADMAIPDGEEIAATSVMQPKIEGEVAFVLDRDLDVENPTIADNASSGLFVLGNERHTLADFDSRLCGMVVEHRGEPVSVGAGAACLGNPLNAVIWLAREMVERGRPLAAGDIIMSGALGPMVPVAPGEVYEVRISGLGSARAAFA